MAGSPAGGSSAAAVIAGTASHGNVTINMRPVAIPALRLLSWHAPQFRVECTDSKGVSLFLPLSELDITHATLARLNVGRPSFVEPQLAPTGK